MLLSNVFVGGEGSVGAVLTGSTITVDGVAVEEYDPNGGCTDGIGGNILPYTGAAAGADEGG